MSDVVREVAPGAESVRRALVARQGLPSPPAWVGPRGIDVLYTRHASGESSGGGVSVIIPAWNSAGSLAACVTSIVRAAGVVSGEVEIIVVDDESDRPAVETLDGLVLPLPLRVVRVRHRGQSRACNTGARLASGALLVFCDSDLVIHPWGLRELTQIVAATPRSLCFGFREETDADDPRVRGEAPPLWPLWLAGDNRFRFDVPGFPSNLFAATRQLRDLTAGRRVEPPGRFVWSLPTMAYGCLLGCHRRDFVELGGFDGRFTRWGYNDTELAARWIASGGVLQPVFTANGLHLRHPPRHPLQWRIAGRSRRLYDDVLAEPPRRPGLACSSILEDRLLPPCGFARAREPESPPPFTGLKVAAIAAETGDLGLFEAALDSRADDLVQDPRFGSLALRVLRLSGAPSYLERLSVPRAAPPDADSALERGLWALARGDLERMQRCLREAAQSRDRLAGGSARYLLRARASHRLRGALRHLQGGVPRAAATGLLSCLASPDLGHRRAACLATLDELSLEDRRLY